MTVTTITRYRVAAVTYAVLVFTVSSWPGVKLPDVGAGSLDKLIHFGQYAILAVLVAAGWGNQPESDRQYSRWLPVVILAVFVTVDEYHQRWVPGREVEIGDWLANLTGIACGWWVGTLTFRRHDQPE